MVTGSRCYTPHLLAYGLGLCHGAGEVFPLFRKVLHTYSNSTTILCQHSLGRLIEEYFVAEEDVQLAWLQCRLEDKEVQLLQQLPGEDGWGIGQLCQR